MISTPDRRSFNNKQNLMVRRREAPSRTMGRRHCVAPPFEMPGFAGLLRMRTQFILP